MNIRTTLLAVVMAVPFLAGAALAADTGRLSLTDAVKSGNLDAARSLLSEAAKEDVAGPVGTSALLEAASRNDAAMTERCHSGFEWLWTPLRNSARSATSPASSAPAAISI